MGRTRRSVLLASTALGALVFYLAPAAHADATLSIVKSAAPASGGTVEPGDTITYTIEVTNAPAPADPATGVTITDATPADTTYVAGSATIEDSTGGGPVAVPDAPAAGDNPFEAGYALAFDIDPDESATATFDVTVDIGTADATDIDNTATVDATNDPTTPLTSNTTIHTVSAPDLSIDKTAVPVSGGPVDPGDTITYTIVVANDIGATGTATNVTVTDPTPADTTFVPDSATENGTAITSATNPFETGYTITDPDADLDPGEDSTLEFQVLVTTPLDNGTVITNTATVESDQTLAATSTTTHTVASAPVLTVSKTASPAESTQVVPGTEIAYTITVTNSTTATETAHDLVLTDPTPSNTSYVAGSATLNGTAITGSGNPLALGLDLPDLDPGDSHVVTLKVKVDRPLPDGTVIANLAKLTADNHADVQDAASHTVDSTAILKAIGSATFPRPGSTVEPGDRIRYIFQVTNDPTATASLSGTTFRDPTPEGTSYVDGSSRLDGQVVPDASNPFAAGVSLGTIAPGVTRTVQLDVVVNKSAKKNVTNTATVTATNHAPVTATVTHRVRAPGSAGGGGGGGSSGGGGGGSGGGTGTTSGTESGSSLALTGLELARLALLAVWLLLAGWTLLVLGRARRRKVLPAHELGWKPSQDEPRFPTDGFWVYPPTRD